MMKVFGTLAIALAAACFAVFSAHAAERSASPSEQPGFETTSPSSIWTRPGLLDEPGSPIEALRNHGINLKAFLTQTYMGLPASSASHGWQYGGKMTFNATFDGAKLGAWQGFFVNIFQEWNYGNDINDLDSGAVLPINAIMAFPHLGGSDSDTAFVVTQKFGETFVLSLGKFALLDKVSKTPLVGGGGYETFLNAGLAGPVTGIIPAYIFGAVAMLKTRPAIFTLMVFDPRNAQEWDVISNPFSEGMSTALTVTSPLKISRLPGFYSVRGVYSTKTGLNLAQIPALAELPPESQDVLTKKGSWLLAANFQQYLFEDTRHTGSGWGLFGYLSVSDGNPNPLKWAGYIGLGGNSPLTGRRLDKWGVAFFKYGFSTDLINGLSALGIKLRDEQGVEVFYNLAVTPWFRISPDVQWISPADPTKDNIIATGLRMQTVF